MKNFPFQLKPFVLITTFFGVVGIGGFAFSTFKTVDLWPVIARDIEQRDFEERKIDQRQLSAARNLIGTWKGDVFTTWVFADGSLPCSEQDQMTLTITAQNDNTIAGTVTTEQLKITAGPCRLAGANPAPQAFNNGAVSGSRLSLQTGSFGNLSGSFTTDTITLRQDAPVATPQVTITVTKPINLLRQN